MCVLECVGVNMQCVCFVCGCEHAVCVLMCVNQRFVCECVGAVADEQCVCVCVCV